MRNRRGSSTIEFSALITIILAAILVMGVYFKRGLQGRWKTSVDDVGEQYDPAHMTGDVTHTLSGSTRTMITTIPDGTAGTWTMRDDQSNIIETKEGKITILTAP